MRTALLGGEVVDIIINTWPAFRAELVDAGILRPIDDQWASARLDAASSTTPGRHWARSTARPMA